MIKKPFCKKQQKKKKHAVQQQKKVSRFSPSRFIFPFLCWIFTLFLLVNTLVVNVWQKSGDL